MVPPPPCEEAGSPVEIDETALAEIIHGVIENEPHHRRLYPDLYALEIARAVIAHLQGDPE